MENKIDFEVFRQLPLRLTKVKDLKYNNQHPNGINEGFVVDGYINVEESNKSQCLLFVNGDRFFNTAKISKLETVGGGIKRIVHTDEAIYELMPIFEIEYPVDKLQVGNEKNSKKEQTETKE
jgi:hypothetical protein